MICNLGDFMKKRIITGAVLIALAIPVCIYSYTPIFAIMCTLLALIGVWEMLRCVGEGKHIAVQIPAYLYTLVICASAKYFMPARDLFAWTYIGATITLFVWLASISLFSHGKYPVDELFATFGGVYYVASCFSALILLRENFLGEYLYLVAIVLPLLSDTFAYFVGVFFGKHKLILDVSPKKTVEGSIGGIVGAALCSVIFAYAALHANGYGADLPHYAGAFVAGAAVAALSQIGDLLASLIKRKYGVKDYGFIFPGHGGVLDRLDSVLLTSPLILLISFFLQYVSVHEL